MAVSKHEEVVHQIITLSVQGTSRRAVARALGISRNTVRKVMEAHVQGRESAHSVLPAPTTRAARPGDGQQIHDQIAALLAKYPDITAQRISRRCATPDTLAATLDQGAGAQAASARPAPSEPGNAGDGPGEMAESDWSPYTVVLEGGGRLAVQAFSYVLRFSHRKSRPIYREMGILPVEQRTWKTELS